MKNSHVPATWFAASFFLVLAGCAKTKKAFVEPTPPAPEVRAPAWEQPQVADEELRRQRIRQEAAEVFRTVYFSLDQSALDPKALQILVGVHAFMSRHPEVSVLVEGHCDERGTEDYNLALGEKRAISVTGYLGSLGISASRMRTVSYGEEKPEVEGHGESQWKQNRRARLVPEFHFKDA